MTGNYKELVAKREALDKLIADAREKEIGDAVEKIRQLVAEFGLKEDDVFPRTRRAPSALKGSPVPPKYRDPATGATWTGRGKPPKWIKDQDREKFAI